MVQKDARQAGRRVSDDNLTLFARIVNAVVAWTYEYFTRRVVVDRTSPVNAILLYAMMS